MIKRALNTVIAFLVIIQMFFYIPHETVYSESLQDNLFELYNSFNGYSNKARFGYLPDGVKAQSNRKHGISLFCDADEKYGEAISITKNAQPDFYFGKTLDSGKLHISFDIRSNGTEDTGGINVGFYDTRKSVDCSTIERNSYSYAIKMNNGNVAAYQRFDDTTDANDMIGWTPNYHKGVTYDKNKWHTVDLFYDFDIKQANYFFDGNALNTVPIGIKESKGFKSLFFVGMSATDIYCIDNLSVVQYKNNERMGYIVNSFENQNSKTFYIHMQDSIAEIKKSDVLIRNRDGSSVEFNMICSERWIQIDIENLIKNNEYIIDLSKIRGNRHNGLGKENLIYKVAKDNDYHFFDNFDSYKNNDLGEWEKTVPENVSLVGSEDENKAVKIVSAEQGDNSGIMHFFTSAITNDDFSVEMSLKYNAAFDIAFLDEDENIVNVAGVKINGVIGCYNKASSTNNSVSNGRLSTPYPDFKIDGSSEKYNRLKVIVDRKNKKYTIVTATQKYDFEFDYALGNVVGIGIFVQNGTGISAGTEVCIDEILVRNNVSNAIYANFKNEREFSGALFYSSCADASMGTLKCSEKIEGTSEEERYNITKENGTLKIEVDSDADLCHGDFYNTYVEIEYSDNGYGWAYGEYDSNNGTVYTNPICAINSGNIKTAKLRLDGWQKNASTDSYIILLKTYTTVNDGVVSSHNRNFSKYPFIIKSVKVYEDGTTAPIDANLRSDNAGNIFFSDDTPEFNMTLSNRSDENLSVNCKISVLEKNKDNAGDVNTDTIIYQAEGNVNIKSGEIKNNKIIVPIEKFGLYKIKVELSNGTVDCGAETEFSKSVLASTQNYTMGVSTHFTSGGNADIGLSLLKSAGMGLIRDDFRWKDYERAKGVYKLPSAHEKLCEAAVKYNLNLLPIIYGNNKLYDGTESGFISKESMTQFLKFVNKILDEEKIKAAADSVEIWNEPDLVTTCANTTIQTFEERGTIYGDIVKQTGELIRGLDKKYKIGAFSMTDYITVNKGKVFMDSVLQQLEGGNYFDAITMHPYMYPLKDPEKGIHGKSSSDPNDYLNYKTNYLKALVTGGNVYNDVTGQIESPIGVNSNKKYHFMLNEPMWYTEYGISTAKYDIDPLSVGNEYDQAIWLIRGFNQIKLNNFDDKVWFYDFADDGDRTNEKEFNFGIVHSYTNKIPYSAKPAFIALAAFNKLTEGATSAANVLDDNYKFITKYHSSNHDAYMLWTSADNVQEVTYDFGKNNIKYYDLYGNEIPKDNIYKNGKYQLTGEPYWAVTGDQPECFNSEKISKIYFAKDGIGFENNNLFADDENFAIGIDTNNSDKNEDIVLVTAAYKNNMLINVKAYKVPKDKKYETISGISFDGANYDNVKFMLFSDKLKIKPLAKPLEI